MTVLRRWSLAIFAAATVVAAGAGGPPVPGDETYQERRARIESMDPSDKKQLLEKQRHFLGLSPEKQNELRKLHQDLQAHQQREELQRIMHAYYEWVRRLGPFQLQELDNLTSPTERMQRVKELHAEWSKRRPKWGAGGFDGRRWNWGRSLSRSDWSELRQWAAWYVEEHGEELAAILRPEQRKKWEAARNDALSAEENQENALWQTMVRWYLAGPDKDLPLFEADKENLTLFESDIEKLKHFLSPPTRERFSQIFLDRQVKDLRETFREMLRWDFATGNEEIKHLVSEQELAEFRRNGLAPGQRQALAEWPADRAEYLLRGFYFESKLPPRSQTEEDGRPSFGSGPRSGDFGRGGAANRGPGPGPEMRDPPGGPPPGDGRHGDRGIPFVPPGEPRGRMQE